MKLGSGVFKLKDETENLGYKVPMNNGAEVYKLITGVVQYLF